MKTVTRENVMQLIETDPSVVIVEALPEAYFRKAHLPGAVNVPPGEIDTLAPLVIPDRNATVVVYCLNAACENSGITAARLEALGYPNVVDYVAGKQDWMAAGLPVEKGRSQSTTPAASNETRVSEPLTMVSCSLDETELAARADGYRRDLFAGARERQERSGGYAFRFAGDGEWRAKIEAFVDAERRCCSFFQIDVSYEAGLGPIWLTLTGPEGTRRFIEETFDVQSHV